MSGKVADPDCTAQCMSCRHGYNITSALTRREPKDPDLAAYLTSICSNIGSVLDSTGRSALHMAAACGRRDLVQWLIRRHGASVNSKDKESGYTPLHRSIFYGQLHVAVSLMQLGASLTLMDNDELTPLDHAMKDKLPMVEFKPELPCEAYLWGSNANYTLGTGKQQSRTQPEPLDCFRKMNIAIRQVCMDKFHSVLVSACGGVWSCGHGQGGRLGLGTEGTVLTPQAVPLGTISAASSLNVKPNSPFVAGMPEKCVFAAVGRDHTLLLMESGAVLTFGINTHHVLGHSPPPDQLLKPRPIAAKYLRLCSDEILGVCAGRFHSVLWSQSEILTFGLNAGQLGHVESNEKTVIIPKAVAALHHKEKIITHVAASDGATVVVYNKNHIFVVHEYQKIRLPAKQSFDVEQIVAVGGHLDSRFDSKVLGEKGESLKVVALSTTGTVFLWQEKELQLTRCILASNRQLKICHLAMNRSSLLFVTDDGEAYTGDVKPRKLNENGRRFNVTIKKSEAKDNMQVGRPLREFLDPNECETVKLQRLPHIHRAVRISCDPKGRNFAAIQVHPASHLIEVPQIPASELRQHLTDLLSEADEGDALHDLIFQVGLRRFPAHQYIVVMNSDSILKIIRTEKEKAGKDKIPVICLENVHPDVFHEVLQFMYSGECSLLKPGPCNIVIPVSCEEVNKKNSSIQEPVNFSDADSDISAFQAYKKHPEGEKKKKNAKKDLGKTTDGPQSNPITQAKEVARHLGLSKLARHLEGVCYEEGNIKWSENTKKRATGPTLLSLDYKQRSELHDVTFCSTDGKKFRAHKCIVAARSEYFHHMLAGGWIETRSTVELKLPLHSSVLALLLDYFYKDATPTLSDAGCEDMELAWNALVSADQLLVAPFKARCESALASMLTLKNVATMLELSHVYNAEQLRDCCYQYICLNLPAVLEGRTLEAVTPEILDGLQVYYHNLHPQMSSRIITPFSDGPCSDEIQATAKCTEISWDPEEDMNFDSLDDLNNQLKVKQTLKKKYRVRRLSEKTRHRNESMSSTNSDDLDVTAEVESVDWSDLVEKEESEITLSLSQIVINKKEEAIKKETVSNQWVKVTSSSKQQKSVQARLKAAAIAREEVIEECFIPLKPASSAMSVLLPPPTPSGALSTQTPPVAARPPPAISPPRSTAVPMSPITKDVLQKHFPELGRGDLNRGNIKTSVSVGSPGTMGTPPSNEKRPAKLSQKQRKKMAAEDVGCSSPPSQTTFRGWGAISGDSVQTAASPPSCSTFGDIMVEQRHKVRGEVPAPSTPITIRGSHSGASTSPWASTPPATPATPPEMNSVASSSHATRQLNFTDIVADEMKQRENYSRMRSKPLLLTQMEDRAIEELIVFYNANNASEERITVRRVANAQVAKPLWVTTRH